MRTLLARLSLFGVCVSVCGCRCVRCCVCVRPCVSAWRICMRVRPRMCLCACLSVCSLAAFCDILPHPHPSSLPLPPPPYVSRPTQQPQRHCQHVCQPRRGPSNGDGIQRGRSKSPRSHPDPDPALGKCAGASVWPARVWAGPLLWRANGTGTGTAGPCVCVCVWVCVGEWVSVCVGVCVCVCVASLHVLSCMLNCIAVNI